MSGIRSTDDSMIDDRRPGAKQKSYGSRALAQKEKVANKDTPTNILMKIIKDSNPKKAPINYPSRQMAQKEEPDNRDLVINKLNTPGAKLARERKLGKDSGDKYENGYGDAENPYDQMAKIKLKSKLKSK